MKAKDSRAEDSYDRHTEHEAWVVDQGKLPSCYTMPGSVDSWRHRRMHLFISPLIRQCPEATWLTIGDGNFASDAYFLSQEGADVTASSLTVASLEIAKQRGYVSRIERINAERIQFADNSFDFVLCKESYHHFPRPPIAFYEMLRVARRAVIFIEPFEGRKRVLGWLKSLLKRLLRGEQNIEQFESSGNFVFRISETETAKMMTALNYGNLAIRRFNDCYLPWASSQSERGSWGSGVTLAGITLQNVFCRFRLLDYGLAVVITFKEPLDPVLREKLTDLKYKVMDLPRNPFTVG